jgi:Fe-S oxidoreductase
MTLRFAPGCGLMVYKPRLAERLHGLIEKHVGSAELLHTCCRHVPPLPPGTRVINVCPGCDRRYRQNYERASTVSAWEIMAKRGFPDPPDYGGLAMTIIDACPTRDQTRVHDAVRELIRRMNISLLEPANTRTTSTCCGDSLWGAVPANQVEREMRGKAAAMPADQVIVYCVSCAKAMFVGGKRPRYLLDLLLGEETVPGTIDPALWHKKLDAYIASQT